MPGGGVQLPGHGGVQGVRMAWTWAGSWPVQTSTRWYTLTHGLLGVCLGTPGQVGMYIPASTHTHLCMWPASWGPVPGRKPRKPLLVLAFMLVGVGLPGHGGVVLFVNTGQGGVGV